MTTTLQQAGLGKYLVGRSAFCRGVPHLPVVGDLQNVAAEQLVRLMPSHVFVQRPEDGVDQDLRQLAQTHGWTIVAEPLVDLHDVVELLRRLPRVFPEDLIAPQCSELIAGIGDALKPVDISPRPRVLIVSPGPSPLAWGRGTYLGQLVEAAGGTNVLPGSEWATLSLEDIARLAPDVLLVPSDGDPGDLSMLKKAVGEGCVYALSCPSIEVPGPHLAACGLKIRSMLSSYTHHP
jgi:ABC-type Fe3+-hydroxamate transport system substrate-binding protein